MENTSTPSDASQSQTFRWANLSATTLKSVRQAITLRSNTLTAMRMYLLNLELLVPEFRAGLMEPAMPFLDHVHHQPIMPLHRYRRHRQHDLNSLPWPH